MLPLLKKKKIPERMEAFDKLLRTKKVINQYKAIAEDPSSGDEEVADAKRRLEEAYAIYERIERMMIDVEKGLYMGVGLDLKAKDPQMQPIYFKWNSLNGHMGVQGTTRVGKTVLLINVATQLIRKDDNVIAVDPKGGFGQEILAAMVDEAARMGSLRDLVFISPAFVQLSDRINTLFGMNNQTIASLIAKLTESPTSEQFFSDVVYKTVMAITASFEAIEAVRDPDGSKRRRILAYEIAKWNRYVKTKGIEVESVGAPELEVSIPDALEIMGMSASVYDVSEPKAGDYVHNRTFITFRDIAKYANYESLSKLKGEVEALLNQNLEGLPAGQRSEISSKIDEARFLLNDILEQEKDFFTKISVSLSTILTQLSSGSMGHLLCDVRINPLYFRLLDPDRRVIALIQPFPLKFKKISDMSVKIFMAMIEFMMGMVGSSGRPLNRRIHLLVDEAAQVAYPGMETLFSVAGGLGVSLYMFTQSFADWKLRLGDHNASVIMDNINTHVRMRMNDVASCELVAKEFGMKKSVKVSSIYEESATRHMIDEAEEWLVPPETIRRLPVARALIKNDTNIYVADLPYYSGAKGEIVMPRLDEEALIQEMLEAESALGKAMAKVSEYNIERTKEGVA